MGSTVKNGIYPIEQYWNRIRPNIKSGRMILDKDQVRVGSMRMQLFMEKGMKCVFCGIEGKFFRKEINAQNIDTNVWHLNLYAEGPRKRMILMTKDHIIPICKGGKATMDNLQPMCAICNNEVKGSRVGVYERLLFLNAFMKFNNILKRYC